MADNDMYVGKTQAELIALLQERDRKDNTRTGKFGLTYRVGEKGGLSAYGLGRWPVTLYASQWRTLISAVKSGEIEAELDANKAVLKEKPVKD